MKQSSKKALIFLIPVLIVLIGVVVVISGFWQNVSATQDQSDSGLQDLSTHDLFPDKISLEYANGFSVEYHGTYKVVRIHDPWGREGENRTYLLVQRGESVPSGYPNARVFHIPVKSVVTLSSVHLPNIMALNETSSIVGHNGISTVYNEEFHRLADAGKIVEVGSGTLSMDTTLQTEKLIELEPDIVFCSANGNPEYDNQNKLLEAGLSPAVTGDWMENHPLARAEWIKYYALFFNKEKVATEFFDQIKANYTALCEKTANVSKKPTLFAGIEYQGTWYAPGKNSYVARLFSDAGGDYVLRNNSDKGDSILDFESVYDTSSNAEYWLNTGYTSNIQEMMALDSRYNKFSAVKAGNVYQFNARVNKFGGNDYWESGIIHPDIILADIVKILHPEVLPDHELYYYSRIGVNQTGAAA
ncbi:MAG TPA: ABC transporter substrate-binding protein [Methanospirillum sp.]|uniref:ABC transporter substrate-binding protein n=1 Tax=Methanospirillum sp. TaxID=45200 RepID=UPI002CD55F66|nr:ABC transporter substrate-binding protein [Methanospirillum sp.]HWQ63377.1 ABC transporter substrate-binding protein [Methanospirillum sp.]